MATEDHWGKMCRAVAEADLPTIERYISEGIDVNTCKTRDKWNLLHLALAGIPEASQAVEDVVSPAVVKRLIEAGVDVNAADSEGWTPLHFATRTGSLEAVQLLLDAGAKVNVQTSDGITPLHRALIEHRPSRLPLIEVLLNSGADPDVPIPLHKSSARIYADRIATGNIKEVRQLLSKYPKQKR